MKSYNDVLLIIFSVVAGVNMRAYGGTRIVKQFSGNFWWATADYYARLEASQPMARDYLGAAARISNAGDFAPGA